MSYEVIEIICGVLAVGDLIGLVYLATHRPYRRDR